MPHSFSNKEKRVWEQKTLQIYPLESIRSEIAECIVSVIRGSPKEQSDSHQCLQHIRYQVTAINSIHPLARFKIFSEKISDLPMRKSTALDISFKSS